MKNIGNTLLGYQVGNKVEKKVVDKLKYYFRNQAYDVINNDYIRDQVWFQGGFNVWNQVEHQVKKNVKL